MSKKRMTGEFDKIKLEKIQQALLRGEKDAFGPLVVHHQRFVYQICKDILKSTEEAEEITQDVFIKAFHSLGTFKGESRFSTWLYRIAHNLSLNRLAKIVRNPVKIQEWNQKQLDMPTFLDGPWEQLAWDEQKKLINFALEKLTAEERLMVTLYYMHGQGMQEIGEITKIPANTCKVKIHRARKKMESELQRILKEEVGDI
nr:sigma-70 family RNA polymerase sigma factor [Cytophagales bacterium]